MASIRALFVQTTTYTYPLKQLNIQALDQAIGKAIAEHGLGVSKTLSKGCGAWAGIGGEQAVISLSVQGLFFMYITVCYTKKHTQVEICYYPVIRKKGFQDSPHAMRSSQWNMMINSTFEIVRECIETVFGTADSVNEEEEAPEGK